MKQVFIKSFDLEPFGRFLKSHSQTNVSQFLVNVRVGSFSTHRLEVDGTAWIKGMKLL